ncbi:MAG TPA: type IV pilus modification protein PilV [Steroidobacteraceae bacterium]|nr:type IV pilus modification protein PilV [Steroidobacteraceae bacterium]
MIQTRARNRVRGFTLVEALVALLALSIGLLGVAGLQLAGLRANLSASWRSQGTYLAYDILDRMRANRDNRKKYVIGTEAAVAGASTAATDLVAWKSHLASTLPGGNGTVALGAADDTVVVITVQWDDSHGVDPPLVFTMRSRI